MGVTAWFQVLDGLGSGADAEQIDPAVARLANLLSAHADAGCDQAALRRAMDCLMTGGEGATGTQRVRACMAESGLSGGL